MLAKETMALPDIIEVLGQRPYPMKASLLEYIQELKERKVEEEQLKKTTTEKEEQKHKEEEDAKKKPEESEKKAQ